MRRVGTGQFNTLILLQVKFHCVQSIFVIIFAKYTWEEYDSQDKKTQVIKAVKVVFKEYYGLCFYKSKCNKLYNFQTTLVLLIIS